MGTMDYFFYKLKESLTVKDLRNSALYSTLAFFWQQAKQLDKKPYSV